MVYRFVCAARRGLRVRLSRGGRRPLAAVAPLVATVGALGFVADPSAAALPPGCSRSGEIVSCTNTFTSGSNPFTVPAGVSSIDVLAVGGMGGSPSLGASGGYGAVVSGDLTVNGGSTVYAVVGANGVGETTGGVGGGAGGDAGGTVAPSANGGAAGGGASDVRTLPNDLSSRLLVAAGGGGGGGFGVATVDGNQVLAKPAGAGGAGGGNVAAAGDDGAVGGGGGSGSSGGAGGLGGSSCFTFGPGPGVPQPLTVCGDGDRGSAGGSGSGGGGGGGGFAELIIPFSAGGGGGGGGGLSGGGGGGGGGLGSGGGGGGGSNLVPPGGSASIDFTGVPMIQISYKLVPTTKAQCMSSGWHDYPQLKNQGDCVSFVETGK